MKKYIVTENKTGKKFERIGSEKKINYSTSGRPFFKYFNTRIYFDEAETIYPIMYYKTTPGDIDGIIGGVYAFSNCFGIFIEIMDGGEAVQTFREIED